MQYFQQKITRIYTVCITYAQKNPFKVVIGIIFSIYFCVVLEYPSLFTTTTQTSQRVSLPNIQLPSGTMSLITLPDQQMTPLLQAIQHAQHSIDVVLYQFTDKHIADALIAALDRKVAVRVLLDKGYKGKKNTNSATYIYLKSHGIQVSWAPDMFPLTHQKTIIIDSTAAYILTYNLVPKYYSTGRDFGIIDTDKKDVTAIENTFDADWNKKNSTPDDGDTLVWSPGSEHDMQLIIQSAKKNLKIYNEEMADQTIIDALILAAKKGISVHIIMTYQTLWKKAFQNLIALGVHIHLFHGKQGLYIHAKAVVADDTYAFVGSENFSTSSLENNRELGVFVSDKAVLRSLVQTFLKDWNEAKEYTYDK